MAKETRKRGIWWLIATWFGAGQSPIISGTIGSLAALPFAYFIQLHFGPKGLLAASIALFFIGTWASNEYLRHMGGEDPSEIVVDEVAAQWLVLVPLSLSWHSYLVGFIAFRLFDILKPWPVSWADRSVEGALGVMLDDIMASLYILLLGFVLYRVDQFGISDFIQSLL
jgi:phosphatidylglycerophosphatase A